ncbi:hypothetical protein [Enterococcus sp. AZ102]
MENSYKKIEVKLSISNIEELKKLINQAEDQIDQLKKTLEKIDNFKIRVS